MTRPTLVLVAIVGLVGSSVRGSEGANPPEASPDESSQDDRTSSSGDERVGRQDSGTRPGKKAGKTSTAAKTGKRSTAAKTGAGAEKPDGKGRWTLVPVISSSPETSLMLGGIALYHFRVGESGLTARGRAPRRSGVALFAAYTLKGQFAFSLSPSLYLQRETWNIIGSLEAEWFPNTFYEIGQDSADASAEDYTQRTIGASVLVTRALVSSFRAGLELTMGHADITEKAAGGLLDTDQVVGSDGGLVIGAGPAIAWDDRDNNQAPRSGARYRLSATVFPRALGSDFGFGMAILDGRRYISLPEIDSLPGAHVVAFHGYARLSWGNVPFQNLAQLGGNSWLRGYFAGRYIDRHLLATQAEYRSPPLYWRISGAVFAGVGHVAGTVDEIDPLDLKYTGGVGLRVSLNAKDRVNLRIDFALSGDGNRELYISLGEAF